MGANPNCRRIPDSSRRVPRPVAVLMFLLGVGIYVALATHNSAHAIPDAEAMPKWHTECISDYSNVEVAVWQALCLESKGVLYTQSCSTQRKILDVLAPVPCDERDEVIARAVDRAITP
jgi:hypothetical protein